MILPTKAKAKAEYLFEPLFFAMENFSKSNEVFINEKTMMCIEFIYDKNNKNIRRGDHDNKEVKQVIDAISSFVVPDDSDNYLSLCQISSEGEYNHTKVYIIPERCFGAFFSDRKQEDAIEEREQYEELIKEKIEYDILIQKYPGVDISGMVEIMLDAICSDREYLDINQEKFIKRLLKADF